MSILISLGGNALLEKGGSGTVEEQRAALEKTFRYLAAIVEKENAVIVHGNGPQVGNLLIQQHATKKVPPMPLDVLDAMTQGQIGYLIQLVLLKYTKKPVATLITQVVVSMKDPAFRHPTKPIGPFYKRKIAPDMVLDAGRGYRKVVPSPKVVDVVEKEAILALLKAGFTVIAGGGGGIPIKIDGEGIEAVIDKDRLTAFIANYIKADAILFITSVDAVYLDFGKKGQRRIAKMSVTQAKEWLKKGQFEEGSMGPKIESAVAFLERCRNGKVIICSIENVKSALKGKAGTEITF